MTSKFWIATLQADETKGEHVMWVTPGIPCPVGHWLDSAEIDYLVCQVERAPTTGKVHLHAYIQFPGTSVSLRSRRSLTALTGRRARELMSRRGTIARRRRRG